ncbi:histidine--tRNA ligase [Bacteroidetes bacterium endosymbiont of Geopemphigus sp.]|uniref:histidine--tRNA ligase n=1 Tax=Bacteroidetes bacterium endosymbiont of Geopemphigus sp. TaxID=2047937 RepID=UPI000CD1896D|nr:histidine--tRNA ligase [Bacteroidetes bacterium endosymbiont of Geopemphigus sp.]
MQRPSIPKGTRDFSPQELRRRYYLMDIIRKHFEIFGFAPIETPCFENLSVLTGKYGQEGERLIFKILKSGDFMKNSLEHFDEEKHITSDYFSTRALLPEISEKALRYDLTVPFARYVIMHRNDINFPFKRYQIQPVWRADRPQKGRFREFYQCDADVVGSRSLWQEVELLQLYDSVFTELRLPVVIQINHRELLVALAEMAGIGQHWPIFINALDKWDKIGAEKAHQEMLEKGIPEKVLNELKPLFKENADFDYHLSKFSQLLVSSEKGTNALSELNFLWKKSRELGMQNAKLRFNGKLARGLDYYTGTICEVLPEVGASYSIGGGGRYDELTGVFGVKNFPGVGISFGLDRIYLAMETLELFERGKIEKLPILFVNFGQREALQSMREIKALRKKNIPSELYPEAIPLNKQLQYANKKGTYWVALMGEREINEKTILIKNLANGIQTSYNDLDQLAKDYRELIK